jgi:hypothetical protein
MRDASETPRSFKKYRVSNKELKDALGIDWPGRVLSVDRAYDLSDGFIVTMFTQPHELTGADRERLTTDETVRVPVKDPAAKPAKKAWWRA